MNSWKGLLDETLIKKYPHIYLRYALWLQNITEAKLSIQSTKNVVIF